MNNNKIIELFNALTKIKDLIGIKFNYAIAKNIATLKPEIEAIQRSYEATEDFNKYEIERVELAKKHSKKGDNDEPLLINGNQFDIEDLKAFQTEFNELKEKHKEVITIREKQLKEVEEFLLKESNIELHKIKMEDIPKEIKTEDMAAIYCLIEN